MVPCSPKLLLAVFFFVGDGSTTCLPVTMGVCFRGRGLAFVLFFKEERLIPRGLSQGRPPVLFPVGFPRRLAGLFFFVTLLL